MAFDDHKDWAIAPIATAPSPATSGTTLQVLLTHYTNRFPTPPYTAVLKPVGQPLDNNYNILSEEVRVTNVTTDATYATFTITRDYDGNGAVSVQSGWEISAFFHSQLLKDIENNAQGLVLGETPGGTVDGSNKVFTLSQTPASNSEEVFLNGVRQTRNNDYTISGNTVTFTTAPLTGDILAANYASSASAYLQGTQSFIDDEIPAGTIDGSNKVFTTAFTPVANTLEVFLDGLRQSPTTDFSLSGSTITFVTAPVSSTDIRVKYRSAPSSAANADTTDGYHANATPTANEIPVLDANADLPYINGWRPLPTLTYASSTTVTLTGDWTSLLAVGDKIWLNQSGSKYFYITALSYSAPNTTLTLNAGSDYTVANAAITAPYYSKVETPAGFPQWFNWTPTWTNLTVGNGTNYSKFCMRGKIVDFVLKFAWGSTTSGGIGGALFIFTPPVPFDPNLYFNTTDKFGFGTGGISGVNYTMFTRVSSSDATKMEFVDQNISSSYLADSGTSNTVPATWTTNSVLYSAGRYKVA